MMRLSRYRLILARASLSVYTITSLSRDVRHVTVSARDILTWPRQMQSENQSEFQTFQWRTQLICITQLTEIFTTLSVYMILLVQLVVSLIFITAFSAN